MTINDLLGEPDSFDIIIASQFDTILNVAVWPHDVCAVTKDLYARQSQLAGPFVRSCRSMPGGSFSASACKRLASWVRRWSGKDNTCLKRRRCVALLHSARMAGARRAFSSPIAATGWSGDGNIVGRFQLGRHWFISFLPGNFATWATREH
jgi:hypothetical protein